MKDIIFVTNKLGGKGWGGAHRVTAILANYLSNKQDYNVTMIVWQNTTIDYPINKNINIINLNFEDINEKNRIKACYKTREILKQHKNSVVIVLMSRMAVDMYIFSRFLKIKFIGAERTDPMHEPKKRILRIIRNFVFCFMDKTVFQTEDAKAYFPRKAREKGVVIPNPLSPNLPEAYNGERTKKFVTFCRLDKQKNLKMMIDAFNIVHEKYPEYKLDIFGEGNQKEILKEYIKNKNAESYINIHKFEKDIHKKIIKYFAYLSTSDYEGMSNSMLEAMAIGLPCICTDCPIGGAKMMIQDYKNGILAPVGDCNEYAKKIIELIESPIICKKISSEAIKIRSKLDENNICEEWEKIL